MGQGMKREWLVERNTLESQLQRERVTHDERIEEVKRNMRKIIRDAESEMIYFKRQFEAAVKLENQAHQEILSLKNSLNTRDHREDDERMRRGEGVGVGKKLRRVEGVGKERKGEGLEVDSAAERVSMLLVALEDAKTKEEAAARREKQANERMRELVRREAQGSERVRELVEENMDLRSRNRGLSTRNRELSEENVDLRVALEYMERVHNEEEEQLKVEVQRLVLGRGT